MMGFIFGLWAYIEGLGFNLIKGFVFWLAFNYFAPFFSENILELPVIHISFWISFAFFIVVHHIGDVIQSLVPTIIKIDNSSKNNKDT